MRNDVPSNQIINNKLNCDKESSENEGQIVKVVPSMVVGENHVRTIYVYGKGYLNDSTTYPCSVPYCKSGILAFTYNRYPK